MFWYNVISHNSSYYFKMYISEITKKKIIIIIKKKGHVECGDSLLPLGKKSGFTYAERF